MEQQVIVYWQDLKNLIRNRGKRGWAVVRIEPNHGPTDKATERGVEWRVTFQVPEEKS